MIFGPKILVIAAHPDDETLGCGGFIAKNSKKYEFRTIIISEGVSCRYDKDDINSIECKTEVETRKKHCIKALEILGIPEPYFFDYPCGRLDTVPIIEINKIIENHLSEFLPDAVLTHSPTDCNNDHKIIFKSVLMATRPMYPNPLKTLACFEVNSSTEWNFNQVFEPNYFENLTDKDLQRKLDALAEYSDELRSERHPRSIYGIKTQAINRGYQAGLKYAESFQIIRAINK